MYGLLSYSLEYIGVSYFVYKVTEYDDMEPQYANKIV